MTPDTAIQRLPRQQLTLHAIAGLALLGVLAVLSRHNYILFHALIECFCVFVAATIFFVGWKTREFTDNGFLSFLGAAYLGIASLDLLHMLTYQGMAVLPHTGANIPTQLWVAARLLEACALAIAPWMLHTGAGPRVFIPSWALAAAALMSSILLWDVFPDCYREGQGPTGFKIASEYLVVVILCGALLSIFWQREGIGKKTRYLLTGAVVSTACAELCLTLYESVYGAPNLAGHFLKLLSYYLLFKAIVEPGIFNPLERIAKGANLESRINRAIHDLSRSYLASSDLSFADFTSHLLEKAQSLTRSEFVLAGYLDRATGELVCSSMTREVRERCHVRQGLHTFDSFMGLWGLVLREGRTLISSQPEHDPRVGCFPEGHIPIRNFMAAPAMVGNKISGIVAVANAPRGYAAEDRSALEQLTDFYSSALLRNRHEEDIKARERKLHSITEASLDGVVMLDAQGCIVEWNKAAERISGYARSEVLGREFALVAVPERFRQVLADGLDGLGSESGQANGEGLRELSVVHKNGSEVPVEVSLSFLRIEGQGYAICFLRDVSLKKDLERSVERQHEQLGHLIRDTYTGMVVIDKQGFVQFANPAAEHLLGRSKQELSGTELGIPAIEGSDVDLNIIRPDGSLGVAAAYVTETVWEGEPASIVMLHDITDRKEAEDSLEHLAKFDSLTDLPNRYLLLDRLEESMELARRSHQKLGIVSLDLDRFKGINDWLGHAGGDEMLQEVGRRLTQALRSTDTVARMGGDEFIILLESVERPEDVQVVCGKILRALQDPLSIQGQEIVPTCSIGYCLYPDHGSDRDVLLQRADAAMYEAKEGGRGQVRAYSEAFGTASSSSMKLEQDLRRAINSDEFLLAYQPQYELQSGNLSGMEALLRWNHPERGMVSPGEFMNLLEETGLILPVGKQVMQKAAEQVQRWRSAGLEPPRVSVNLSAKQFYNKDLLGDVEDCLKETGLTADCLEMELTETAVMRNMDVSARVLQKLKDRGVRIALDDFGKGYSTLHVLGRIPIDVVKIDSSFIQGVPSDKEKAALTEAIITMAHGLDKQVVAEGVEHAEQKQWLIRMECDHVQGFYFSYPLLPAHAERLLHPGCGSIACGREGMIPGTARRRIPGMQPGAAGA